MYKNQLHGEFTTLTEKFKQIIHFLPVISTHTPHNWKYDVLEMVTGQSVGGTGIMTEFSSTFSDLFGTQS